MTRMSSAARRSDRDDAPGEVVSSPRSPNTNKPRLAPTAVYAGTSAGPSAFPMRKPATAPRTLPPSARLSTRARRSDAAAIPMHAAAQMAKMITNEAEDAPDIQRRMPCRRCGPIAAAHHRHRKATSPPSAARNWLERAASRPVACTSDPRRVRLRRLALQRHDGPVNRGVVDRLVADVGRREQRLFEGVHRAGERSLHAQLAGLFVHRPALPLLRREARRFDSWQKWFGRLGQRVPFVETSRAYPMG